MEINILRKELMEYIEKLEARIATLEANALRKPWVAEPAGPASLPDVVFQPIPVDPPAGTSTVTAAATT